MSVGTHGPISEHLDEDLLLDLAHGLLAADQAEIALAHLRRCPSCDERFRVEVRVRERARAAGAPRPATVAAIARGGKPHERTRAGFPARWGAVAIVAAAAVALIAVILPRTWTARSESIPDYWLPLDRGEITLLRAPSSPDALGEMHLGLQAYERHDAAASLALLERASVPESYRALRDLFRSSALLHVGRPEDARLVLEDMRIHAMPEPWRDRAQWLLYLALRATGERERAEELRIGLASMPGEIGDLARAEGKRP
jgi:hypothetical protein